MVDMTTCCINYVLLGDDDDDKVMTLTKICVSQNVGKLVATSFSESSW